MADLWIPGFTRVNLGVGGGYYDETAHPKFLWHFTQGSSLAGAREAFKKYPPHCGVDPKTGEREQYIPLNWHSWSLRGDESDDEICIQVEVVGFSEQAHLLSDQALRWLGVNVVRPIHELVPIPWQHVRFYGADEGIVLASPNSPIRLSDSGFRNYAGHLGHQHVPAPDEHWDPGRLFVDKIIAYALEEDVSAEEVWAYQARHPHVPDPNKPGWGIPVDVSDALLLGNDAAQRGEAAILRVEKMTAELIAESHDDLDAEAILARVESATRAATQETMVTMVLPALQRIQAAIEAEESDTAKAVVAELAARLQAAAA